MQMQMQMKAFAIIPCLQMHRTRATTDESCVSAVSVIPEKSARDSLAD